MINWGQMGKSLGVFWKKNGTTILTVVGSISAVVTPILAVKATPKALDILEARKQELKVEKLPPMEVVKTCWKVYIPTAISTAVSVGCSIGAQTSNMKQNLALAAACQISEEAFALYKKKVIETVGESKEQKIVDETHAELIEKNPLSSAPVVIGQGPTLCFDTISKRYFRSDFDTIKDAKLAIKEKMSNEGCASLSDFYYMIGLEPTTYSDEVGWCMRKGYIDIYPGSKVAEDKTPCLVVEYRNPPIHGYDQIY